MQIKTTRDGKTVAIIPATGPKFGTEADAVDLMGSLFGSEADCVGIPIERCDPDFFDLANRKLGLFTQKFVNYGLGIVFVGDLSAKSASSKPLNDFVVETRRGGPVRFALTVEAI
ncbi:DUF4180 domain-containing protein [Cucumibacter marinus]|uniref:DUF4180 domain-containing protein n=1 Tax=Cucumibacter marinus TaxID=1121252 RepID=UPI00040C328E|nr:DUF4180 domain-containing protein [Cucumibacter marinus]